MALELRRKSKIYLKSEKVAVDDKSPLSEDFFGLSDFPKYFGEGKNSFRIRPQFGSLKPNTKIDIEVIDSNGNPIYWETPTYKDNDKSRLVSVWIYDVEDGKYNTPDGPCEVIIVGVLPNNQKVRWSRRVDVVKNKKSVSEIIFTNTPLGSVSSSVEVFSNIPQVNGVLTLTKITDEFSYKKSVYGDAVTLQTPNPILNNEMVGGSLILDLSGTTLFPPLGGGQSQPSTFEFEITEVLSDTDLRVSLPITQDDNRSDGSIHTYEYSDENTSGTIAYYSTGSYVTTQNQIAIANITLNDVNPIVGRVSSVNTLIKSEGLPNSDFELIANTNVSNVDTIEYKVPIPTEHLKDPKTLKVQFVSVDGTLSSTEVIIDNVVFEGGNAYIGGDQSLITGSFHIGNTIGTGIEMAGHSSGYLKSVGYDGFANAINGSGPGGFLLWSGSGNLQVGVDNYNGVGLDLVANSESYFRYSTEGGGNLDIRTSTFFIGNESNQFISGANSNIEISSSLFHLDPTNNLLVIGADAVINATLTVDELRTPATINGSPSTRANASSSIDSDGYAKFVSASIGGFEVSDNQISSTNNNLVLKSSGEITGSQVLFDGGILGGFELGSNLISSSNGDLVLNANGEITASNLIITSSDGVLLDTSTGYSDGKNIARNLPIQSTSDSPFVIFLDGETKLVIQAISVNNIGGGNTLSGTLGVGFDRFLSDSSPLTEYDTGSWTFTNHPSATSVRRVIRHVIDIDSMGSGTTYNMLNSPLLLSVTGSNIVNTQIQVTVHRNVGAGGSKSIETGGIGTIVETT